MIIKNEAASIALPIEKAYWTTYAMEAYKAFNPKTFCKLTAPAIFRPVITLICKYHQQSPLATYIDVKLPVPSAGNDVLVCFSGGLDSVYQALRLKGQGYSVTLFHIENLNFYTNGQESKATKLFAEKYQIPLITAQFSAVMQKTSPFHKYWEENSFKDFLIYSAALDVAVEKGFRYISSGDDLRLSVNDAVPGTNLGDAKELTKAFFSSFPDTFMPCDGTKVSRLEYIYSQNAQDDYYSCVGPGRLNQYLHNKKETKYNLKLEKYNCGGTCRKCAHHNLILQYYLSKLEMPKDMEDFQWDKLSIGADNIFFDKSISKDIRIQNLENY